MSPRSAVFRVWGFPTSIHVSILLLPASYAWAIVKVGLPFWYLATFTVVLVVSVLVHELGHALALWRQGSRCQHITLHGLGGQVTWCDHCQERMLPSWKLMVSLAGPAAGIGLGILGAVLIPFAKDQVTLIVLIQVASVNITMNIGNLLPVYPLDGGQATLSFVQMALPTVLHRPAQFLLHVVSVAAAIGLGYAAWRFSDPFAAIFSVMISGFNAAQILALVRQSLTRDDPD